MISALTRRSLLSLPAALALPGAAAAKPRFRTAICAYSFREALAKKTMSYDDLVHLAVDTETDGLDLTVYWFPNQSDSFLLSLRRLAYRHGVEIYSISIRTDMCQPKADLRAKEAAWISTWVDTAARLGAGHIRVFGGNVPKGSTEDEAAGWCAEVLARAGEYAGKHGVILGLENHGGITSRAERIVEIVKKVDSPWVGINLDTGNFDEDAYRQIAMLLPYAVNAQFKTEIREADGRRAASDWERLVKMFAASGYRGYLALEYEAKEDPAVAVPRLMRDLNNLARKYSS
jgi:sugar phosphate isomerase/epimerase